MSLRGVIGAFAVLSGVGASLILPTVSSAGQLAETMTATTISGQLHSNQSKGIGAVNKSRGLASAANERRAYENDVIGQDSGNHQSDLQNGRPKSGVDAAAAAPFDEKHPVKGQSYATDGFVILDEVYPSGRLIVVLRIDGPNKFQVFGYRPHDSSIAKFAKNTPVKVTGVYAAKIKEPQTGTMVHGFDDAVFSAGSSTMANNQAPNNAAAKEEKPTFNSIMKGWAFRGTVQVGGKATGVFVNESKVRYAQVGTLLDEGVRVASVGNGKARVLVDGSRFDVTPW